MSVEVSEEIRNLVDDVLSDKSKPVVLFALEWCDFCWSARKLFKKINVEFHSVDLDSVEFQQEHRGKQVRKVLEEKTDCVTIPQVFVGGEFIGGCTELFDSFNAGDLQGRLDALGVSRKEVDMNAYEFLPDWLQPRDG